MAKIFKKNQSLIFLLLVVLLGVFLRFYRLDQAPISLSGDEVDIGYNSYSLLKTGRDVTGHPWPVSLQTLIDVKPFLLAYVLVPFVKFFGLSEWSVRLPNAILGSLGILVLCLLVKELFANSVHPKGVHSATLRVSLPLIAALLLAISPWHFHFSRGVFEILASHEKDTGGDVDWSQNPPKGIKVLETIYTPTHQPIFYLLTAS